MLGVREVHTTFALNRMLHIIFGVGLPSCSAVLAVKCLHSIDSHVALHRVYRLYVLDM